jgi:hypothetical protein
VHPYIQGQAGGERRREQLAFAGQHRLARQLRQTDRLSRRAQRAERRMRRASVLALRLRAELARRRDRSRSFPGTASGTIPQGTDQTATFMDYHEDLLPASEAVRHLTQRTRDGAMDQFGVRQLDLYHNDDGDAFCLLEGPDEEAVRRHHEALGVPCGNVHRVDSLLP